MQHLAEHRPAPAGGTVTDGFIAAFAALPEPITVVELDGRFSFANAAAAELLGFDTAAELCAASPASVLARFDLLDEAGAPLPVDRLPSRAAMQGQHPAPQIVRFRRRETLDDRWSLVSAAPVLDSFGRVTRVVNVFRDMTEQKRAERGAAFLAMASATLSASLDYGATLAAVARAAVPAIADWCAVDVLDERGQLQLVGLAHADPAKVRLGHELRRRYPIDLAAPHGVAAVLRTGRPEHVPEISEAVLRAATSDEELLGLLRELGLRSSIVVPLLSGGRVLGAITLVTDASRKCFDASDLALAQELARHAGVAVDNAQLHRRVLLKRERLDLALGAGRMGTWEWDVASGRVTWSPQLESIHGIEAGSFPGTFDGFKRDIHPDDVDAVLGAIQRTLSERADRYSIQYRIVRPDGETRRIEAHGRLSFDASGHPARLSGVCMDVTERHEMEMAARALAGEQAARREVEAAHTRMQQIVAGITDPFLVTDRDGTITWANPAAAALGGVSTNEAEGRHLSQAFAAPLGDAMLAAIQGLTCGGRPAVVEAEGRSFELHAYAAGDGASLYMRDVTEERMHARDLARSNAELEQFAYAASHDLQEPLRLVASYAQLLRRRYRERLDSDADEFIDYVVEGATRMQQLIDDLLTVSRVGRHTDAGATCSAHDALDDAVANLRQAIETSGAIVEARDLPTLPIERRELGRVLQNLVGNAIKFRRCEPPRIVVSAARRADEWELAVEDDGIGIDPSYFDRIFTMFQRLHPRTRYPGNGIGLALCKKIIEHRGGRIWVESELDRGSTFRFTLPAVPPAAPSRRGNP